MRKMRKLLMILMLALPLVALTQEADFTPIAESEKSTVLKQMQQQTGSFSCDFVEEKWLAVLDETVVQKGIIRYDPAKELVCEYTEPESLVLCKKKDGGLSVTRKGRLIPPGPMHWQMMNMMEGFISGGKAAQNKDYDLEVLANETQYLMRLMPKKPMRFVSIELFIDKTTKAVVKTVLTEPKGDRTTITMTPRQQ